MVGSNTFLTLELPFDEAVAYLKEQMIRTGLSIMHTFNLQVARQTNSSCPCPHHGTDQCDCQMVVLLVYQRKHPPVSIIAHGFNGQTRFSIVDTPQQRADPNVEANLRYLFAASRLPPSHKNNNAHTL